MLAQQCSLLQGCAAHNLRAVSVPACTPKNREGEGRPDSRPLRSSDRARPLGVLSSAVPGAVPGELAGIIRGLRVWNGPAEHGRPFRSSDKACSWCVFSCAVPGAVPGELPGAGAHRGGRRPRRLGGRRLCDRGRLRHAAPHARGALPPQVRAPPACAAPELRLDFTVMPSVCFVCSLVNRGTLLV